MIFPISNAKYAIMREIYSQKKINISTLFRNTSVSPKKGYQYLRELLSAKIIKEQLEGKKPTWRYLLPHFSDTGMLCFSLIEEERKIHFLAQHKELVGPLQQFSGELGKAAIILIFGSLARGNESKESDLDVLLIGQKVDAKKIEKISEQCFVTLPHRPSIRIVKETEFFHSYRKKEAFASQIETNHIIISGALRWVELLKNAGQE